MTTFGEIVEPVSRTFWEDWDDDNICQQNHQKLNWQKSAEVPNFIDTFLIFEGKYFYDCIIKQTEIKMNLVDSVKEVNLCLLKAEPENKYICIIKDYNLLQSSDIVKLLKPYINSSSNVITVQSKPLAEYQTFEINSQNCLLRTICTTKPSSTDLMLKKLEQPNIISGVSAGVICMRELLNLSGTAVICYIEPHEDYQIEEVQALLQKLNIISNVKLGPSNILETNLYI